MGIIDFAEDIHDEVSTILSSEFKLGVVETEAVPHSSDGAITFPNLDSKTQGVKLLKTAVLYVDMRRSTELNFKHKPQTVAKLYSAFVRAMTRCAEYFGGEVRGIIGDRVMVLFEPDNCFVNAVDTAILMHSICRYVINENFKHGEVEFGFGIDFGSMLVTKTGIRKHGADRQNYHSLVWLGRPANVASKLTDNANKPAHKFVGTRVRVAYDRGSGLYFREEHPWDFVKNFVHDPISNLMRPTDLAFRYFEAVDREITLREATPPILITKRVYDGYKAAKPKAPAIENGWLKPVTVEITGYDDTVYGMDVVYSAVKEMAGA